MVSKVKFVVHPGWVISANDGDRHFIGFQRLCQLYHLNPIECLDASNERQMRGWSEERFAELKHVNPRSNGMYEDYREQYNG